MKNVIRRLAALLLMLVPALALAGDEVMLVELPQSAQMVENVSFEDGDFIQSYQLEDGSMVMLLRYGQMSMTADELAASEWTDAQSVTPGTIDKIDGYPAQSVVVRTADGQNDVHVIVVNAEDATLIMQLTAKADADVSAILDTIRVQSGDGEAQGASEAEVG